MVLLRALSSSFCSVVLAVLLCLPAFSQESTPWSLPRLEGAIQFDGWVDDAAWEAISPLPLTQYEPIYAGEMTERTEIRVAYDEGFLYVSGKMYDASPDAVRANSLYRDGYSGDDTIGLIVDTFNDNETALWFSVTPAGVRLDMAVSNDLEGGGPNPFGRVINISWNTFWDAVTQQNDDGWFVEMRIPYSSLGFQADEGAVTMGLTAYRFIARKNERQVFPDIPPQWNMGYAKPSQAQKVALNDVTSQRPVYITPYVLGGVGEQAVLNDAGDAYGVDRNRVGEIGGDVKFNVTSNLTMDVTVNTDFAQVEADDQQVNLTRFSLFFPEKRQFFQERSSIFEFRTQGRFDRLFNSREIGLYQGQSVPIIGGVRLVGRVGDWDVGLINMQTARHEPLTSENFGVLRLRKQVFNPNSYVGGMMTSRLDENQNRNIALGFDSNIRVGDQKFLQLKVAQTFTNDAAYSNHFGASGFARAWFEKRGVVGFGYILANTWQGPDFNPGIGFVSRTDFVEPFVRLAYGWFADETSKVRLYRPNMRSFIYFRNEDGSVESASIVPSFDIEMKSGDTFDIGFEIEVDDLVRPVSFPENSTVPIGRYTFGYFNAQYMMSEGRLFRADVSVQAGSFYDGSNIEIGLEPTWNVSQALELGIAYQFNRVRFPDRDQEFYVHLAQLKTQIGFNTKASIQSFLQYNSSNDALSANVRFRYNFREGNDLWLVYNEGWNTDRYGGLAVLPVTDNRTVLLKYTYTFIR